MDSPINEIREAFYKANKSREIKLLQDIFYFYINQSESYPDDALDFLLEILETEELFTKRGINKFFFENIIYTYKLSNTKKEKLTNTIFNNYSKYDNSHFCHTLTEIISDINEILTTLNIFKALYKNANENGKQGIELACESLIYQAKAAEAELITERVRGFVPSIRLPLLSYKK